jgi:hypothetical protein
VTNALARKYIEKLSFSIYVEESSGISLTFSDLETTLRSKMFDVFRQPHSAPTCLIYTISSTLSNNLCRLEKSAY